MTRIALRIFLVGMIAAMSGCGSGFVDGWRDDETGPEGTKQEICGRRKGYVWVNDTCQSLATVQRKDAMTPAECSSIPDSGWYDDKCLGFFDLNESQCASVADAGWIWHGTQCTEVAALECQANPANVYVNKTCHLRPILDLEGDLAQTVLDDAAMRPIILKPSRGSQVRIVNGSQSCENYFAIDGNKLSATKPSIVPMNWDRTCSATLVAVTRIPTASNEVHVTVRFRDSFLKICKAVDDGSASKDQEHTVGELLSLEKVNTDDCAKANKALSKLPRLDLVDKQIVDLSPLASLTNLRRLELPDNEIKDISPIAELPLNKLNLSGNPIVKSEATCPTGDDVNAKVREFCEAWRGL